MTEAPNATALQGMNLSWVRKERLKTGMSCRLWSPQRSYFYPVLVFSGRVLLPQVPRPPYPIRAGDSAIPASQHLVHHSPGQSIPVWFTVGLTMCMSNLESLVPQLRPSEGHIDQTACRERGLVAAKSSSVDVPFSWLISMAGKMTVQSGPTDASDGLHVRVTMLPRAINRRIYSIWSARLVEIFYRVAERPSVASCMVRDGKLPRSVVYPPFVYLPVSSQVWRRKRSAGRTVGAALNEYRCIAARVRLLFLSLGRVGETMRLLVSGFGEVARKANAATPTDP